MIFFFLFNNVKHVICTAESKKKFLESLLLLEQDRLKYEILCRSQQIGQTLYRRHLQIKVCFETEVFWHHYHRQLIISHYRIISSAHVPIFFLCKTRKHRIKGKMKDCIKSMKDRSQFFLINFYRLPPDLCCSSHFYWENDGRSSGSRDQADLITNKVERRWLAFQFRIRFNFINHSTEHWK